MERVLRSGRVNQWAGTEGYDTPGSRILLLLQILCFCADRKVKAGLEQGSDLDGIGKKRGAVRNRRVP